MNAKSALSLEVKIYSSLTTIFLLILVVSIAINSSNERQLASDIVKHQVKDIASSYFDSINMMMITGTMNQRETLQQKFLAEDVITEARIIRSEQLNKLFGPGLDDERPDDEWDQKALTGENVLLERQIDGSTVFTSITPLRASSNYRGTNCLTCHQVAEGEILGAVRISYSMADLEKQISDDILKSSLALLIIIAIGLAITIIIFRRFVISRVKKLHRTVQMIEANSDLTQRIKIYKYDEIGHLTDAFNRMLDKFQLSLKQVTDTAHDVKQAAGTISEHADITAQAVAEQQGGTDMMAAAINEMETTSHEVKSNAEKSANASNQARQSSNQGVRVTTDAISVISRLSSEISQAADVIEKLNTNTQEVGSVLDVIKGIAEQTNLLALNAAIEAARAGESGRGFAVVADEVRTLATKTHESAEEIETMIHQLQEGASNAVVVMKTANGSAAEGVQQVQTAMTALNEIDQEISNINDLSALMRSISEDQSKAAEEINATVLNISHLADNSSHQASETSKVSQTLRQLANQLDDLVSAFKIQ